MRNQSIHYPSNQRGYTLIVVVTIVTVLLVLGVGSIRIAGRESKAATATSRTAVLEACARSARELMVSQLRFMQPIPTSFHAQVVGPDDVVGLEIGSGCHDTTDFSIGQVEIVTPESLGAGRSPSLHRTRTSSPGYGPMAGGSTSARVTAICRDETGRSHEVEFMISFGI